MAQFDRMEQDLKRLRQDADHLTVSIRQLEVQEVGSFYGKHLSSDSWVLGVQGLILGIGVLIAGMVLARLVPWWMPVRAQTKNIDFMESALYLAEVDPIAAPPKNVVAPPALSDVSSQLLSGGGPTPPDSIQPHSSQPDFHQISEDSCAPEAAHGFDSKAAASDVERVRKSLADKRAERWSLHHKSSTSSPSPHHREAVSTPEADLLQSAHGTDDSNEVHYVTEADQAHALHLNLVQAQIDSQADSESLDIDLGFDLDPTIASPEAVKQEISEFEVHTPESKKLSQPEAEPSVAQVEETAEVFDTTLSVKLALAQEFHALGLMEQARELATEILASGHQEMAAMAGEVLSRIDVEQRDTKQQQQDYAALVNSLRDVEFKSMTE